MNVILKQNKPNTNNKLYLVYSILFDKLGNLVIFLYDLS